MTVSSALPRQTDLVKFPGWKEVSRETASEKFGGRRLSVQAAATAASGASL
jgi:hypothetical protein